MMKSPLVISVVIPVYNSEESVALVVEETRKAFAEWEIDHEIILVNDGSRDNSWSIIEALAQKHDNITAINFLKNYGQHNALLCGLKYSKGDYVVTIDDDLQNPPREIIKLIEKSRDGHDLVMGKFIEKKHSLFRRVGSKFVQYLNRKVFGYDPSLTLSNFRLIHKDVVQRVINYKTSFPYIPGLVLMFSSRQANVFVEHNERTHGVSNYNIVRILKLVSRILFNYSSYPLRMVGLVGAIAAVVSFGFSLHYLVNALLYGTTVPGWATLAIMLSFFNGLLLLMLSMIGEYMVRLVSQASSSDAYYIRNICPKESESGDDKE